VTIGERPLVVAVDPGKANGVGLVRRDGLVKLYSAELTWRELASYLGGIFREYGNELDVVVESFTITHSTANNAPGALGTIEVIGQVRLMAWLYGVLEDPDALPLQTPRDAQDFTDSAKLRALGWWHKGGKGHANMALRHCALRLLRTGTRDRTLLGLE
jgi:hypothetical protein